MKKRILAILLAGMMFFDSHGINALAIGSKTSVVTEMSITENEQGSEQETQKQTESESSVTEIAETDEESKSSGQTETDEESKSSGQTETEESKSSDQTETEESKSSSQTETDEESESLIQTETDIETETSEQTDEESESLIQTETDIETETSEQTETITEISDEKMVNDEQELVSGDFEYSLSGSDITITKYKGSDENVTVPEKIDGNKVVNIGNEAFRNNRKIKTVIIPDTVTLIGNSAFYGCSFLTDITMTKNLASLGAYAFYGCSSLNSINLPESLTIIDNNTFYNCRSLTDVNLSKKLTEIGSSAFYNCTALTGVILPETLTSIGNSAFRYCTSLTDIVFHANLITVGNYAFANCEKLKDITFSDSQIQIGSYTFYNCDSIEKIEIKNNNEIGSYCFSNCNGITEIIIGDNVILNDCVFSGCNSIKSLKIGQNLTKTDRAFSGINLEGECGVNLKWKLDLDQCTLEITGNGAMYAFKSEAEVPWINFVPFIESLSIGSGVTTISSYAFKNFDSIESINLSRNITTVGDEAFYSCDKLKNVEISATVKSIGKSAFGECNLLTKIIFCGDAPILGADCIPNINTLTAYYPETATGWNERLISRFPNVNWQVWDNTLPSKDVVLVLDTSGSMSGKMDTLKEAASRFVDAVGGTMYNTRISVVEYDSSARVISDFSTDKNELLNKISMLTSDGGTQYTRALNMADSVMQQSTARYRCMVMFSDGEPNDSKDTIRKLADRLGQSYYMYTVGLISNSYYGDSQRQILVDVAGSEERYFEASDIDSLVEAFLALADDIGKSEDTIVEIKRHNERRDILKNQEAFCVNSSEIVSLYVTPGTKFSDVRRIVIEQNGQEILTSETGWFENIVPGSLFTKGQPIYAKLYDSKKNLIDTVTLKIDMRDYFVITYKLNGETDKIYTTQKIINGEEITAPDEPTLTGYVFKGWYSSKACTGKTFFDIQNSRNRLEIEDDITLYAKWKAGQDSVDLTTDVWHFKNFYDPFCTKDYANLSEKELEKYQYEISDGDFNKLLSNISKYDFIERTRVRNKKKDSWGGSCFGMSAAVSLAKAGDIDISHFYANAYDVAGTPMEIVLEDGSVGLNVNGDKDVGSIESMINYYQLLQYTDGLRNIWKRANINKESDYLEKIISKLENTKQPSVLCIRLVNSQGKVSGHAVVAYNFAKNSQGDTYTFEVYDCSLSYTRSYPVKVTRKGDKYISECEIWEKDWNRDIVLTSLITVDDIKQQKLLTAPGVVTANAVNESPDSNIYELTTTYADFTISDGKNSAVIKNGNKLNGSLEIECYGSQSDPNMTPEYFFILPVLADGSKYEITADNADTYKTSVYYNNSANGFFVKHDAQTAGKITVSSTGKINTQYASKTKQNIEASVNGMDTQWYYTSVEIEDSSVTIDVQNKQIDVKTANDTEMNIDLGNDFNVISFDSVKVDSKGISVVEGVNGECNIEKDGKVTVSNGFGHSVVFDSQCGTAVDKLVNVAEGSLIDEPEDPRRDGYIFEGWFKENSCETLWDFTKDTVTDDTILYAGWSIDSNYFVSVTFKAAGQDSQSIYLTKGKQLEESQCPEIIANEDKKWYKDEKYTVAWDFVNDSVMENTVLYAKGKDCNISFVTECNAKIDKYTVYAGSYLTEPEAEMKKDGYTLCGWYVDATFNKIWNFKNDRVMDDTTLYAKWIPNERDKNGNDTNISIEIVRPNSYQYSGKAITPTIIVRDGDAILKVNKDYKVTYKNNKSVCDITSADVNDNKKPQIIIQGIGVYKSNKKFVKYFSISPKDFADLTISIPEYVVAKANNGIQQIKPVVKIGNSIVPAKDYTIAYYNDVSGKEQVKGLSAVGAYSIVIEAKKDASGKYTGNYFGKSKILTTNVIQAESALSGAKINYVKKFNCNNNLTSDQALQSIISSVTLGKDTYSTSDIETFKSYFTVSAVDINGVTVSQARLAKILRTAGTKTVKISALSGNSKGYRGSTSVTIKVQGTKLNRNQFTLTYDKAASKAVTSTEYTGKVLVPDIVSSLIKGKDYTVSYMCGKKAVTEAQIINAGKYSAVIRGINQYNGVVTINFTISPVNVTKAYADKRLIITSKGTPTYDAGGANAVYSITYDPDGNEGSVYARTTLKEQADYTISYKNNKKVTKGKTLAYAVIAGKGNFTGTLKGTGKTSTSGKVGNGIARELNFSISKKSLSSKDISIVVHGITVKGKNTNIKFTLYDNGQKIASKEYSSKAYANGSNISLSVSAKGINYSGYMSKTMSANMIKVSDSKKVKIAYKDNSKIYYTGAQITPEIIITDENGNDISSKVTVEYSDNTNVGQGTITIKGKIENGYCDMKVLKFTILPKWMKWNF